MSRTASEEGAKNGYPTNEKEFRDICLPPASVLFLRNQLAPLGSDTSAPATPHSVENCLLKMCLLVTVLTEASESSQFLCYQNKVKKIQVLP